MKKIEKNGLKILKLFHVLFSTFGGGAVVGCLLPIPQVFD